jgi:hypothetical protein
MRRRNAGPTIVADLDADAKKTMKGYSDILRGSPQGSKERTALHAEAQQPPRSVT